MKASSLLTRDRTASAPTAPLDTALVFGHGTFQRLALLCATLSIFIAVSNGLAAVVFARPVEHWCRPPAELAFMQTDVWKNQSIPMEPVGTFSKCSRYEPLLDAGNATENRTVVFCNKWDYDLATAGKSIVSEWNLVCHRHRLLLLHSLAYYGGAIAGSVIGCFGDRLGRKPVFMVALLLQVASGTATILSKTVLTFIILRFLTSVTSLTVMNMASVLLFDVTKTTHRVVLCAFAASCTSAALQLFHFLLLAVGGHWRVAQAILMVPTCFLLFTPYATEESPCWLLGLGDVEGTERAVISAARVNGYPLDDVKVKMNKIKYGVFDEYGSPKDSDYPAVYQRNGKLLTSTCSADIRASLETENGSPCSLVEGAASPDCVAFTPIDEFTEASSSLMFMPPLTSINAFCGDTEDHKHNADAPTPQNVLCDMRSTWDVISNTDDFRSITDPVPRMPTEFRIVKGQGHIRIVFVLDLENKINMLRQAASRSLEDNVPDGSDVGIITFSDNATVVADMRTLSAATRQALKNAVPSIARGSTAIGKALMTSVQVRV
ncbi:solute carrier family 22 member 6-B-like [Ixodes scapularis]